MKLKNKFISITFLFLLLDGLKGQNLSTYSLADISKHNTAGDCWMAIGNRVYDVSGYSAEHTSKQDYDYSKFCGTDASLAWETKAEKGEKHRKKSKILLEKFFKGERKDKLVQPI